MKTQLFAGLLLALSTLVAVPATTADTLVGAGASGQCYNADASQGGEDEVRVAVNDDGSVQSNTDLQPLPGQGGITDALVMFVMGTIESGGQTGKACKRADCQDDPNVCPRLDYVEADATVAGTFQQVCYRGQVSVANDCPTSPNGP